MVGAVLQHTNTNIPFHTNTNIETNTNIPAPYK